MQIRPQVEFPLLDEYKKKFAITEETIFALGENIYSNYPLPADILVHEFVHLKQQAQVGLTEWVYDFLEIPEKRLGYEVEAYREQIKSIRDRNNRAKTHIISARQLSSDLYGNIVDYKTAYDLLKI